MNKDNLIPGAHALTPEERSLGGVNGAISRRAKKRALEIARDILSMPVDEGTLSGVKDIPSMKDASEVTLDVMTAILANMAQKAIKGDPRACRDLLTISGDYTTKQETTVSIDKDLEGLDQAIYDIFVGVDKTEYKLTYYDDEGNITKIIYGEEARRLGSLKKEWNEDFQIEVKNADDEEDIETITFHLPMSEE